MEKKNSKTPSRDKHIWIIISNLSTKKIKQTMESLILIKINEENSLKFQLLVMLMN